MVDYARRRFLRIFPAYWLALTVLAIWPGLVGVWDHPWAYYLLIQNYFGTWITGLTNGNLVVTDPCWNGNIGAIYLYDGRTREIISMLTGTIAGERLPKLRDVPLHDLGRGRRRPFSPEVVDQAIGGDDLVRVEQEHGEKRTPLPGPDRASRSECPRPPDRAGAPAAAPPRAGHSAQWR